MADESAGRSGRKPIMAGNWKMHHTHLEAIQVVQKLSYRLSTEDYERCEVVVCPTFTSLRSVQTVIEADRLPIGLGAQNVHWEEKGAFTGEVSPSMLAKLAVSYVIVGHSERRELFGETDEMVNKKVEGRPGRRDDPDHVRRRDARGAGGGGDGGQGVPPGPGRPRRGGGRAGRRHGHRLRADLGHRDGPQRHPGGRQRDDRHHPVDGGRPGRRGARRSPLRIQYGGSVKPGNVAAIMAQPEIDGALVGGASLEADDFAQIVRWA